jgi:hypothetical protein
MINILKIKSVSMAFCRFFVIFAMKMKVGDHVYPKPKK